LAVVPAAAIVTMWHRLTLRYGSDDRFIVEIDGNVHMAAAPDTSIGRPLDITFRGYDPISIDNVILTCTR
jgi:hypothetical protein